MKSLKHRPRQSAKRCFFATKFVIPPPKTPFHPNQKGGLRLMSSKALRIATLLALLTPSISLAHPGRAAADGCHNQRSTSTRHCHGGSTSNAVGSFGLNSSVDSRAGFVPNAADSANFTCGSKRVCREMASCKEARFYLEVCGLRRLDGDGDGTPCESICR